MVCMITKCMCRESGEYQQTNSNLVLLREDNRLSLPAQFQCSCFGVSVTTKSVCAVKQLVVL